MCIFGHTRCDLNGGSKKLKMGKEKKRVMYTLVVVVF